MKQPDVIAVRDYLNLYDRVGCFVSLKQEFASFLKYSQWRDQNKYGSVSYLFKIVYAMERLIFDHLAFVVSLIALQ